MLFVQIFSTWNNLYFFFSGERLDQVETEAMTGTMKPIVETWGQTEEEIPTAEMSLHMTD